MILKMQFWHCLLKLFEKKSKIKELSVKNLSNLQGRESRISKHSPETETPKSFTYQPDNSPNLKKLEKINRERSLKTFCLITRRKLNSLSFSIFLLRIRTITKKFSNRLLSILRSTKEKISRQRSPLQLKTKILHNRNIMRISRANSKTWLC